MSVTISRPRRCYPADVDVACMIEMGQVINSSQIQLQRLHEWLVPREKSLGIVLRLQGSKLLQPPWLVAV